MEIGAAGEGLLGDCACARDGLRHGGCRFVLRHIIGIEPRGKDLLDAGRAALEIGGAEHAALLEQAAGMPHRMGEDGALGLAQRQCRPNFISPSEPQRARHFRHDRNGDFGRALGADVEADGAVDAGRSRLAEALAVSRSRRDAWVFFEPSAPI